MSMQIRLEGLSNRQEAEADQLGMLMANRAGWSSRDMVGFYRKLAVTATSSVFGDAYPSMASRLSMAQGMARLFDTRGRGSGS
jgi:predicted Zn-dependent protease